MNNELYHYGVIGMKWGVRRYQNSDGTLTDAGKARYVTKTVTKKKLNGEVTTSKKYKKINPKDLSTKELQEAFNRLNLESNYRNLKGRDITGGMNWLENTLIAVGTAGATAFVKSKAIPAITNKAGTMAAENLAYMIVRSYLHV